MKRLGCICLLLLATLAHSQTSAPPSPAEQQCRAWLEAFNSGDRATLLSYLQTNRPSSVDHLDDELEFRARTGGFLLRKAEGGSATTFKAILQERDSDQFARIEMEIESAPPYRITRLGLEAIPTPPEFALPRLSQSAALAALRATIEGSVAADRFSGTALVAAHGRTVFAEAYGMADRERNVPNRLNTKFRIGSMNKMFTAVAVLQLVQAGKIKLTDPLGKYLPGYANRDLAAKVTIHHLLTHTGGTGDFFGPEFEAHRLELRTLDDYVKLYEKRPLEFEPGSRWEYSNFGFLLLGVVIEKASGQSYYDYVREHIFNPAGMASTDSLPETEAVPMRSVGYTKSKVDAPWTPNTETLPWRGTSAGGGYSTVQDLARFADALETHRLLDEEHTRLLLTGKVDSRGGQKYAYGFFDTLEGGVHCYGHGGGAPGMNGELKFCPASGYVIAVLSNLDPPAAQKIADFAAKRLPLEAPGRP